MIISASYKTDIPAFYSDWFMNRLQAGYCMVKSSYGGQMNRVSLKPQEIDGFVFWTRNIGPLLPHLDKIREIAPFVVQMTITDYPVEIENSVIAADKAIKDMARVVAKFGSKSMVWRYDPIFISPATPIDWHYENFARLAKQINGLADEVVVSFMQYYKKADINMLREGVTWTNPNKIKKLQVLDDLSAIAAAENFKMTLCTQPDLVTDKYQAAHCIDANRLFAINGEAFKSRLKGNRPGCMCSETRDIGSYDSCPHGCVYCYAVVGQHVAKASYKNHNPEAESL